MSQNSTHTPAIRKRIPQWMTGLALLLALLATTFVAYPTHAAAANGRVTLPNHLVPALKNVHPNGPTAGAYQLQLNISLALRDATGLEALISEQNDTHSPLYHQYLTPAEFAQRFSPTQATVDTVVAFLQSQGLHVSSVSPNRLLIHTGAPVSVVERAFQMQISDFTLGKRVVYAPTSNPSVPSALAGMIVSVEGLNNTANYHSMRQDMQSEHAGVTSVGPKAITPHAGSFSGYYTPQDLRTAYDMNSLTSTDTGVGQTVGILELDGYQAADVNQYLTTFSLGTPKYSNVLVDGATNSPGAGALEAELDMEVVSAIAPGANQLIYIGPNSATGFTDIFNQMVTSNTAKVVSNSWGACETYLGSSELQALDNIFSQGASQGQAFFSAAGDAGAYDCGDTNLAVDSPASDPNVVGVGGTTLTTTTSQTYVSETTWSCAAPTCTDKGPNGDGSGGGLSSYFGIPNYQAGPNVINQSSNGHRQVPDVSANADPNTGYVVYCTVASAGCPTTNCPSACFVAVGGTSAAAPLWAGVATDINQYLAGLGKPTLGSTSAMLYQLFNTPQTYSAYHDITGGNNLHYSATTGYDLATGIGTPDVWNLARDAAAGVPARSVATTWYFGEGYTGAGFSEFLTLANPNNATASVQVTYLLDTGSPIVKTYSVAATSRYTVYVNNEVPAGHSVSMVVTASLPIVAERPMYFTYSSQTGATIPGGTDVLGATALGTQYDFGYLDTSSNPGTHDTFLTILNPQSSAMTVTIHYYAAAGGAAITRTHSVPANSRGTVFVGGEGLASGQYGALVTLSTPGLVERPMYLVDGVTGYTGSADVVGVSQPLTNWYFAEGYTASTFSERYMLFNPNSAATSATVTFLKSDGSTATANVTLAAGAQQVVNVNSVLGSGGVNNSATVTASAPIVAERFMSFSFPGASAIPGATDVIGAATPGYLAYFAEGYTGGQFSEYLTLENPDPSSTAYVLVKYLPSSGGSEVTQTIAIPAHSRYTVYTNSIMANQSFSMVVQSGLPVVAERPMYFNYGSGQTGGTDIIGYQP